MKKLLFALAGAASFAVLAADPTPGASDISIVGFENYTADRTVIGYGDDGASGNSLWTATGDDASLVKTYGGDNAAAPNIKEPAPFDGAAENAKYLALDTNGSELQRAIPAAGQTIAADGTYIDTLVQFTPSESAPTSADLTDAKLAIWLGVVENVTNLYVQGGYYTQESASDPTTFTPAGGTKTYKLSGTYQPGTWYRLTVKACPSLINGFEGQYLPGFVITVDGQTLAASESVTDANAYAFLTSPLDMGGDEPVTPVIGDNKALLDNKQFIPSLSVTSMENIPTLTSVGFKGTGALDDFVVTTAAPDFTPAAIDFTLTWPAGLTAVSYQIGNGEPVAISGNSPFAVPGLAAGDVVKFIVANADGAQKTLTGTAGTDTGLDATGQAFTWADYLGDAVDGAYEIDNLAELKLFQKGVANTSELTTVSTTFKLTADIALDEAWPGIGIQNAKDLISFTVGTGNGKISQAEADRRTALFNAAAFAGTFDGQNHTVSGFQMVGVAGNPDSTTEGLDYAGFFNCAKDATIQNLKIQYAGALYAADTTASTKESGATFVGVAKNSTLRNLTSLQKDAQTAVSCSKGFGGIVGYTTAGTVVDSCTNNVNMTSLAKNKCGGIAMITQNGSGSAIIRNCQNNGTQTTGSTNGEFGGIVGYISIDTTIENCESIVSNKLLHRQTGTVTMQGTNKGRADVLAYSNATNLPIDGLAFATVDGNVATFVKVADFAMGNTYKVTGTAAIETTPTYRPGAIATFNFTAAGTIAFDTSLAVPTWNVTADEGLDLTFEDANNVRTYTAAAQGGDDYVVEIEGSDVVITPQAGDLEALAEAGVDTNSVAAVNAALATTIEGTSIPAWQALFLGVAPTTNGLETVAIKSISIAADGTVTVEMADGVTLKTGRGVDIKLKLMGSNDLSSWTQIGSDITNTKVIPAITPAEGETKKFYKVVVDFAGSQN